MIFKKMFSVLNLKEIESIGFFFIGVFATFGTLLIIIEETAKIQINSQKELFYQIVETNLQCLILLISLLFLAKGFLILCRKMFSYEEENKY